ncbi:MAG: peptidoglycan DD-metalloendopeptidase family protein [Gammaproteobacteria bacterium]|nr:peptidoglycan DD-metalloendopeptidase family protein [Gammaproteobacteria bacterium]
MRFPVRTIIALFMFILVSGCINPHAVNQYSSSRGWYQVRPSDTLYSIAWRYGLDYRELAKWNKISVNSTIYPGQKLLLIKPSGGQASIDANQSDKQISQTSEVAADTSSEGRQSVISSIYQGNDPRSWLWPTKGRLISTFSAGKLDRRGIDIAGKLGQPVIAVADGKVVYSGNGLAGYGNLIIIKHSDRYLSAYAYSQQRLVKEGTTVKAGNVIAKMGNSKSTTARLHFQIRKNGKPVDPMIFLPKQ